MSDIPVTPKEEAKLSDEQIAALLADGISGKPGKKKRDERAPSPRFPEALYMYLFTLFAGVILLGVWGYMLRGVDEVMSRGPRQNAPFFDHILFNLRSTWQGFSDQFMQRPYIAIGMVLGCLAIFIPKTSLGRKRMMRLISGIIVATFATLIALQFTTEMKVLTTPRY